MELSVAKRTRSRQNVDFTVVNTASALSEHQDEGEEVKNGIVEQFYEEQKRAMSTNEDKKDVIITGVTRGNSYSERWKQNKRRLADTFLGQSLSHIYYERNSEWAEIFLDDNAPSCH